ncbi:solute carrier family 49 member 4-like [Amphiura filiformis]|uniref:solute carrier family 49 member 4-like n=1 Tax=Amphiura filiformis TaxID=82378 RepID=UPI003B20FF0E
MGINLSKNEEKGYAPLDASSFDDDQLYEEEEPVEEHVVYKRRFYILVMFSVASIAQILIWNFWAPVASTAMNIFGWNQADIALLSVWGGVISVFVCIPFAGIMDKFGLRVMFLIAETLGFIGAAIRCIPVAEEYLKWTANIGQAFIALAGPFLVQGPSLMSAAWFPSYQRTTATAIAQTSMGFGVAISFILGPWVVQDSATVNNKTMNVSQSGDSNFEHLPFDSGPIGPVVKQKQISDIYRLLYIECAMMAILCIAAWIYFPAKPPTPPSVSASKTREEFLPGVKKLIRSPNNFWIPGIAYGISIGVPNTWATQLVIMFQGTVGLPQDTISWIAFYTYCGGVIGAFTASRCIDHIGGKMRVVILILFVPAIIALIWLMLIIADIVQYNLVSIYLSTVLYGTLMKSSRPIFLEMACEGVYPVAEGITVGSLNWLDNCYGCVFFFIMMIPNIGQHWMNWAVLASMLIAVVLLLVFKEESKRLEEDRNVAIFNEQQ